MSFAQKAMDISNNNYIKSSLVKFKLAFLGEAFGEFVFNFTIFTTSIFIMYYMYMYDFNQVNAISY